MLVAIRIRPLSQKENSSQDIDIIRAEDKLLVTSLLINAPYRLFLTRLK